MEELNLVEVLSTLSREQYCIIKYRDISLLLPGSDLDIFAFNIDSVSKKIIDDIHKQHILEKGFELYVSKQNDYRCYIDIVKKNKIYFRFDIYGELPKYTKANIKKSLFERCIENKKIIYINDMPIKVAAKEQERIIRYLEYIEWYDRRPDKIKHLEFILNSFESETERNNFFEELHYYTDFPNVKREIIKDKNGLIEDIKYIIYKCKGKSISDLWAIFKQKFF